jgi:phosphatidylglycerol---prolipoprotein diacylglyceryl transferase
VSLGPSALAVIELAFDPLLRLGPLIVPLRALGVAGAIMAGLLLAAYLGRREGLRADDLLFVAVGAVLGAVVGGRLLHALVFWPAYQTDLLALLDPARGSLSLTGAVAGGCLAGTYVATHLDGTVGTWADVAAAPLLLAVGLGKLAQLLGGSGQGSAFDGSWAVAFVGPGPWAGPSVATPAHPAQVYEGLWALLGVPVLLLLFRRGQGSGRLLMVALTWWLLGRIAAASTWRDDHLVGPFNAEQVLGICLFLFAGGTLIALRREEAAEPLEAASTEPPGGSIVGP